MATALQFGAGNIGRGFMGQLFFEAGYRTVFVESDRRLADLINARRRYPLRLLDAYTKAEVSLSIEGIEALGTGEGQRVAEAFARAEVAGTAVGVENLPAIAPLIAAGIRLRKAMGAGPVDVYLCENSFGAAARLREAVHSSLSEAERGWAEANVGFAGTSVARMVPAPSDRFKGLDPLFVAADSYHRLPYDGKAVRAPRPPIEGMVPVANFKAEVERKLFTHNLGHAALGYIGYLKGYTYVHEPFDDEYLAGIFTGALEETARALVRMYPRDIDAEEHRAVLGDVRVRFGNPMIQDTVTRVARDPLRKLAPGDRLIGSAAMCLTHGIFPETIGLVCGAAFLYDFPEDPAAMRLQGIIAGRGRQEALRSVSGVEPESPLGKRILSAWDELEGLRAKWKEARRSVGGARPAGGDQGAR
jgi:mannitol-1-phosphate 5-dehydrogenase